MYPRNESKKGKYSPIWHFFEVVDRNTAKCVICNGFFSYRSTTSNLRKHIDRKHATLRVIHSALPKVGCEENGELPSQQQSPIFQIASTPKKVTQQGGQSRIQIKLIPTQSPQQISLLQTAEVKKIKKERKLIQNESDQITNDMLMQLFIKDYHPISIVEDEGFRNFVKKLNPAYELPSKKYISQTLLPSLYEKCVANSKAVASTIKSACVTTECWTANNDESFLSVTVHFLNSDFYLKSILISCSLLEENFTSETLAHELNRNIVEWGLLNKIVFSVSSGEDYIANAIKYVLKWEHFGCFAHSINKVIGDALNLRSVEGLISKVRQVISFFKNDSMGSSELQLSQINCNMEPRKLKQDIPLMWNSTFYMLERFVELENAISCTVTIQESNLPLIQPDDWIVLKELTKILRSLEAITKAADQENYILASLPIVLANGLFEICRKLESCQELSEVTKLFVMKLKSGFNAKFNELSKNPILSVCTFLDPRFKTIPFGENEGSVKKCIIDLVTKNLSMENKEQHEVEQGTVSQQQNIEELSVWEVFDKTAANTKLLVSVHSRVQLEVERYIEDDLINRNSDPLEWWRVHRYNYPHLSEVVGDIFCSLATSVPCSRLFTKAGNIVMDRRLKLSSSKLRKLVFLNANDKLSTD